MKSFSILGGAACACLLLLSPLARAHITLEYPVAQAGRPYKATFRVGHGCSGSPVRQIVVNIPVGARGAKPMPKPGWEIATETAPLAQPHDDHGRTITHDVSRITWTARSPEHWLLDTHYDEFVLQARLAGGSGPMYWKVSQLCAQGRIDWTEVPADGQSPSDLRTPAAVLEVLPSANAAAHH